MAVWKATMYFAQQQYGWSECFYLLSETATGAAGMLAPLATARGRLLAQGVQLTRAVVSLLGSRGTLHATGIQPGNIALPPSLPYEGLILNLSGQAGGKNQSYRRTWMLRGLPESFLLAVGNPSAMQSNPAYARLQAFVAVLTNGNFSLQVASKENPWYPIGGMVQTATSDSNILGTPLPGYPADEALAITCLLPGGEQIPSTDPVTGKQSQVFIRNVNWSVPIRGKGNSINGCHVVLGSLPGIVQVSGLWPVEGQYRSGGFVQLRQTQYVPITAASPAGVGKRKCGKPLYSQTMQIAAPPATLPIPPGPAGPGPGQPAGPWNPGPVRVVLNNLNDMAAEVFKGYNLQPDGLPGCIRISPFIDYPHRWCLTLSGVDQAAESSTTFWTAFLEGIGFDNPYLTAAGNAITQVVPAGDTIWCFGHSLGGMIGQSLVALTNQVNWNIPRLVTYGSPVNTVLATATSKTMFCIVGDLICFTTPYAILSALTGSPELTFLPPGPNMPFLYDRHNGYDTVPAGMAYGADGYKLDANPTSTLRLGSVSIFTAPAL